jgi:hypothetical protein
MKIDESKIKFEEAQQAEYHDLDGNPIYLFRTCDFSWHWIARYRVKFRHGYREYSGVGRWKEEAIIHLKKAFYENSSGKFWGKFFSK